MIEITDDAIFFEDEKIIDIDAIDLKSFNMDITIGDYLERLKELGYEDIYYDDSDLDLNVFDQEMTINLQNCDLTSLSASEVVDLIRTDDYPVGVSSIEDCHCHELFEEQLGILIETNNNNIFLENNGVENEITHETSIDDYKLFQDLISGKAVNLSLEDNTGGLDGVEMVKFSLDNGDEHHTLDTYQFKIKDIENHLLKMASENECLLHESNDSIRIRTGEGGFVEVGKSAHSGKKSVLIYQTERPTDYFGGFDVVNDNDDVFFNKLKEMATKKDYRLGSVFISEVKSDHIPSVLCGRDVSVVPNNFDGEFVFSHCDISGSHFYNDYTNGSVSGDYINAENAKINGKELVSLNNSILKNIEFQETEEISIMDSDCRGIKGLENVSIIDIEDSKLNFMDLVTSDGFDETLLLNNDIGNLRDIDDFENYKVNDGDMFSNYFKDTPHFKKSLDLKNVMFFGDKQKTAILNKDALESCEVVDAQLLEEMIDIGLIEEYSPSEKLEVEEPKQDRKSRNRMRR